MSREFFSLFLILYLFRCSLSSVRFFSFCCCEKGVDRSAELFYILSSDIEFACKCTIMRRKYTEGRMFSGGNVGTEKSEKREESRDKGSDNEEQ